MAATGRVIDIHAHAVLEAAFGAAGRFGPELAEDDQGVPFFRIGSYVMPRMPYRGSLFMDVTKRLAEMDRWGIDVQLLSPNPLTLFPGIPAPEAVDYCRAHNDAMAELVRAHPGRLLGAATLPMQDLDAALAELERSVGQLGLVAPYLGTDLGYPLDDPRLDDFYRTLVALDVPLFLHPGHTDGDGPPADPRLGRFDLSLLLGYAYDETIAVASLVFGGVLQRHPNLDVCISHGGGTIGVLVERFQFAASTRPWVPEFARGDAFTTELRKLWFDSHVDGAEAQAALVRAVGADRMVFGTNFGGWDSGGREAEDPFTASLTPNAERLLRLAPTT